MDTIESRRMHLQHWVDSSKTAKERNILGQFATPFPLACEIVQSALHLIDRNSELRFIDPAFGTGSFYSALLATLDSSRLAAASGYEIDPDVATKTKVLWKDTALRLIEHDFTRLPPPTGLGSRYDLMICNPPYVRHHHMTAEDKTRLKDMVKANLGLRISGLTGLYCYFLLLSHDWLRQGGLGVWLIPSEFMDVNYGVTVKRYLMSKVTLIRIHRYDPRDAKFSDAAVSSCVVFFTKQTPEKDHTVEFSFGGTLDRPKHQRVVALDQLIPADKWSRLASAGPQTRSSTPKIMLSDLFVVKRGLATGSNKFFILNEKEVDRWNLPRLCLQPILPSPRYLEDDQVLASDNGEPILDRRLFLVSSDQPMDHLRENNPSMWAYLQHGIEIGIPDGYLCSHRSPWYSQEVRPAAPLLCTYMGRPSEDRQQAFRFILNHSRATATNVYLMLYPREPLKRALAERDTMIRIWEFLRAMPKFTACCRR